MKKAIFIVLAMALFFSACQPSRAEVSFYAMDTEMTVTAYGPQADQAAGAMERRVEELDRLLSISNPNSQVFGFNAAGQAVLDKEALQVVQAALELFQSTGGAFDVTIAPLVEAWGFYSGDHQVPSEDDLAQCLALTGSGHLSLDGALLLSDLPGVKIDLGGIAKGYAADAAAEVCRQNGVESAVISLGGNVLVVGEKPGGKPWKVAITDPFSPGGQLGALSCRDTSVVTSGSYIRYFEQDGVRYHHILDPATGCPADSGLASVSVVCPSSMVADGLCTALFVMGLEDGAAYWRDHSGEFDAIFVTQDGQVYLTAGLEDAFTAAPACHPEVLQP